MIELRQLRNLSHDELVHLVKDIWDLRTGWSAQIVNPPQTVNVSVADQESEVKIEDGKVSADILAIQSHPYIQVDLVHVRQGDENNIVDYEDTTRFSPAAGMTVDTGVIVTTGAVDNDIWDTRLDMKSKLIDGATLCELVDKYSDEGIDYEQYFEN